MNKLKTSLIALLAIMATLSIMGVITVSAYGIEETAMCYGYSESTLSPLGTSTAFLTSNEEAGVWLKITNPPDDVTFKFYYTENGIEKEYTGAYSRVDVVPKDGTNWGIAFTTMDISGKTPEFKPGVWTSKAYIDGEVAAIINFSVIDYTDLSSQISQISESVQDIVDEKDRVLEDYNDLATQYAELESQYEDLEDTSVSELQLMQLNSDYEDLQDDYDSLEASQASTKTMMYAAIVVALVAVVVAVYFGVMKK